MADIRAPRSKDAIQRAQKKARQRQTKQAVKQAAEEAAEEAAVVARADLQRRLETTKGMHRAKRTGVADANRNEIRNRVGSDARTVQDVCRKLGVTDPDLLRELQSMNANNPQMIIEALSRHLQGAPK